MIYELILDVFYAPHEDRLDFDRLENWILI